MKVVMVGLSGVSMPQLVEDERLENLARLGEYGCYGALEGELPAEAESFWQTLLSGQTLTPEEGTRPKVIHYLLDDLGATALDLVTPAPSHQADRALGSDLLGDSLIEACATRFSAASRSAATADWGYIQLIEDGFERIPERSAADLRLQVDVGLGQLLAELDEGCAIMLAAFGASHASSPDVSGFFVLTAPACLLSGEVDGVTLLDVAPTLLELSGFGPADALPGRSFVSGHLVSDVNTLSDDENALLRERLSGLGYLG